MPLLSTGTAIEYGSNSMWIYKITNLVNKKIYVGKTKEESVQKRWNHHISKLRRNKHYNKHLQSAWNKHGEENFTFEVIEKFDPLFYFDIDNLERYWIKELDSMNPENGYNKTIGGDGGSTRSEETRKKMSEAQKGRQWQKGPDHPSFGKKLSPEHIEKLKQPKSEETKLKFKDAWTDERKQTHAEKQTGEKNHMFGRIAKTRKKIKGINLKTLEEIIFDSVTAAANFVGAGRCDIRRVCQGVQNYAKGFKFEYIQGVA